MAAATIAISCARGEAVSFPFTHEVSDVDATVVNITGWTIVATIRDENGNVVLLPTVAIVSGAAGTYTLGVTHAQTLLEVKTYDIDVWRTDAASEKLMGVGTIRITKQVKY